jgi:hypothetical protein
MFSIGYDVYRTNIYDLLRKESTPSVVYVEKEVPVEIPIETPFEETQTFKAMNTTIKDLRQQHKSISRDSMTEGFKKGVEIGQLEGLAMATTPILGRRITETNKETIQSIKDNDEYKFEIPTMFKKNLELLNPITDKVSNLDDLVGKVYEKQQQGEKLLDKTYYNKESKLNDKGKSKFKGKLVGELMLPPESKQFNAPKSRTAIDILRNGISVGKKVVIYPSYQIAQQVNPEQFTQTKIINELKQMTHNYLQSFQNKYNN